MDFPTLEIDAIELEPIDLELPAFDLDFPALAFPVGSRGLPCYSNKPWHDRNEQTAQAWQPKPWL